MHVHEICVHRGSTRFHLRAVSDRAQHKDETTPNRTISGSAYFRNIPIMSSAYFARQLLLISAVLCIKCHGTSYLPFPRVAYVMTREERVLLRRRPQKYRQIGSSRRSERSERSTVAIHTRAWGPAGGKRALLPIEAQWR